MSRIVRFGSAASRVQLGLVDQSETPYRAPVSRKDNDTRR